MARLKCKCGFVIDNIKTRDNIGYFVSEKDIESIQAHIWTDGIRECEEVWKCPKCLRIALFNNKENPGKPIWYGLRNRDGKG